jgi:hypothetical protein
MSADMALETTGINEAFGIPEQQLVDGIGREPSS